MKDPRNEELVYLAEQVRWLRTEAQEYAQRVEALIQNTNGDAHRTETLQQELDKCIRLTEQLAGHLQQSAKDS